MNSMKSLHTISDRIKEIRDFAKANDYEISLFIVQDIIKNKKNGVDEDLLNQALETLREEGIKTVSYTHLCGVPLYVLSPLIKVDTRPVYGYSRLAPMPYDYGQRLADGWEDDLRDRVDFKGIKLVKIDPRYITAIISEAGIVPSGTFFSVAMQYDHNINGGETRL